MPMLQQAAQVQEKRQEGSAAVLDICLDWDDETIQVLRETKICCDACGREAFIFQEEGNFCLRCWQERTEPLI